MKCSISCHRILFDNLKSTNANGYIGEPWKPYSEFLKSAIKSVALVYFHRNVSSRVIYTDRRRFGVLGLAAGGTQADCGAAMTALSGMGKKKNVF